jgi:hypothetical protein
VELVFGLAVLIQSEVSLGAPAALFAFFIGG